MLKRVLNEIEKTRGVICIDELNRKLNIERSVMDGMIQYLIQTGRLVDNPEFTETDNYCTCNNCSSTCTEVFAFPSASWHYKP